MEKKQERRIIKILITTGMYNVDWNNIDITTMKLLQDKNNQYSQNAVEVFCMDFTGNEERFFVAEKLYDGFATEEMLSPKVNRAKKVFNALEKGYIFNPTKIVNTEYFADYKNVGIGYAILEAEMITPQEEPVIEKTEEEEEGGFEISLTGTRTVYTGMAIVSKFCKTKTKDEVKAYLESLDAYLVVEESLEGEKKILVETREGNLGEINKAVEEHRTAYDVILTYLGENKKIPVKVTGFNDAGRPKILFSKNKASDSPYSDEILRLEKEGIPKKEVLERILYMEESGFPSYLIQKALSVIKVFKDNESVLRLVNPKVKFRNYNSVLENIFTNYAIKRGVSLVGAKSVGKNVALETFAWLMMLPLYEFNVTEETSEEKMKGGKTLQSDQNGNTVIVHEEVQLLKWAKNGGLYVVDEINMARPSVLSLLNSLVDGRRRFEIDGYSEPITLHETCMMAITYNDGDGFAGTNEMNTATKSRFAHLRFEYPENIEDILEHTMKARGILDEKTQDRIFICQQIWKDLHGMAVDSMDGIGTQISTESLNLRGFEAALESGAVYGPYGDKAFKEALFTNIVNSISDDVERSTVEMAVRSAFEEDIEVEKKIERFA